MIQFHVYPGGKEKIVTFSYDDGSQNAPSSSFFLSDMACVLPFI